tara:strand:+ start:241 stop:738 length:498 start_codon:yes stop_codon:yes gene_type:complete
MENWRKYLNETGQYSATEKLSAMRASFDPLIDAWNTIPGEFLFKLPTSKGLPEDYSQEELAFDVFVTAIGLKFSVAVAKRLAKTIKELTDNKKLAAAAAGHTFAILNKDPTALTIAGSTVAAELTFDAIGDAIKKFMKTANASPEVIDSIIPQESLTQIAKIETI